MSDTDDGLLLEPNEKQAWARVYATVLAQMMVDRATDGTLILDPDSARGVAETEADGAIQSLRSRDLPNPHKAAPAEAYEAVDNRRQVPPADDATGCPDERCENGTLLLLDEDGMVDDRPCTNVAHGPEADTPQPVERHETMTTEEFSEVAEPGWYRVRFMSGEDPANSDDWEPWHCVEVYGACEANGYEGGYIAGYESKAFSDMPGRDFRRLQWGARVRMPGEADQPTIGPEPVRERAEGYWWVKWHGKLRPEHPWRVRRVIADDRWDDGPRTTLKPPSDDAWQWGPYIGKTPPEPSPEPLRGRSTHELAPLMNGREGVQPASEPEVDRTYPPPGWRWHKAERPLGKLSTRGMMLLSRCAHEDGCIPIDDLEVQTLRDMGSGPNALVKEGRTRWRCTDYGRRHLELPQDEPGAETNPNEKNGSE